MDKAYVKKIANIIANQLGGAMFLLCTKAKLFCGAEKIGKYDFPYLKIEIGVKPFYFIHNEDYDIENTKLTHIKILLNEGLDMYVVHFLNDNKIVKEYEEVFCDELIDLIQNNTNLFLKG